MSFSFLVGHIDLVAKVFGIGRKGEEVNSFSYGQMENAAHRGPEHLGIVQLHRVPSEENPVHTEPITGAHHRPDIAGVGDAIKGNKDRLVYNFPFCATVDSSTYIDKHTTEDISLKIEIISGYKEKF